MSKCILFGMMKEEPARKKPMAEAGKCSERCVRGNEGVAVLTRVLQRKQPSIFRLRSVV